jgi:ferredoxin-nitrite reductase
MENWLTNPNSCPGLFYGTSAQDGFLIRLRVPGGILTQLQAEAIADWVEIQADAGSGDTILITNRANLQIRAVLATPTPQVFQRLQTVGLAARDPTIDHLRNVMASPTAGIDPQEIIDTRPWVQALDTYIQSHLELAELSAKFSIGIDGGGSVGIGTRSPIPWEHRYNEIQLSAVKIGDRPYFHLALAGDKQLCDTHVVIEPEHCLSVVATLTALYLEYVRQNPAPKKRRMKHLLQDWGLATYLERVNRQLSYPLAQKQILTLPTTQRYGHLGVHRQRQPELSYIGVNLSLGQVSTAQLRGLIELSATLGSRHLRLTPWQTVLIPDISNDKVPDALRSLLALGFTVPSDRYPCAIVACTGQPGCSEAVTQTQPQALTLAHYLNSQLSLDYPVNIHLTGCGKSCAQPSPGEITLLGVAIEQNGESIEGYQVYIGDNHQSFAHFLGEVPFADIPFLISNLLQRYQQRRVSPQESLGEFTRRYPVKSLRSLVLSAIIQQPCLT